MFTASRVDWPSLIQFSVFLPNQVGELQHLLRSFKGEAIRILGISVANLVDCAVVRFIFNDPELARRILHESGYAVQETSLLAVELSDDAAQPILDACATLLQREVGIDYVYAMLSRPGCPTGFVLHVDDLSAGAEALQDRGFTLLSEADVE